MIVEVTSRRRTGVSPPNTLRTQLFEQVGFTWSRCRGVGLLLRDGRPDQDTAAVIVVLQCSGLVPHYGENVTKVGLPWQQFVLLQQILMYAFQSGPVAT